MGEYTCLDVTTGKVTIFNSDTNPVPGENQIIYDPSVFGATSGFIKSIMLGELIEGVKKSLSYVREIDMGQYGKGLVAKDDIPRGCLILPYTGFYTEFSTDKGSRSPYNVNYTDKLLCLSGENKCFAHSAQFMRHSKKKEKDPRKNPMYYTKSTETITANSDIVCIYLIIKPEEKYLYLPILILTNSKSIKAGSLIGWDYGQGLNYFIASRSGYVEWREVKKGNKVLPEVYNRVSILEVDFDKRKTVLFYETNPEEIRFFYIDSIVHYLMFPSDVYAKVKNSSNYFSKLPLLFAPEELLSKVDGEIFIEIPECKNILNSCTHYNSQGHLQLSSKFLQGLTFSDISILFQRLNITSIIISNYDKSWKSHDISLKVINFLKELGEPIPAGLERNLDINTAPLSADDNLVKYVPPQSGSSKNRYNFLQSSTKPTPQGVTNVTAVIQRVPGFGCSY